MDKEKFELSDDDLSKVTGGLDVAACQFFLVASGRINENCCENCFYYQERNGRMECGSPNKQNQ